MIQRMLAAVGHLLIFMLIVAGIGCEDGGGGGGGGDVGDNDANLVIAMGDSITAGEGLSGGSTYPAQLAQQTGKSVNNSGRSGARSSFGVEIIGSVLERKPGYVLILYGANDLIFGVDKTEIVNNLRTIVQAAKANQTIPIVGTLTPTFPWHDFIANEVIAINPMIKQMANEEGAKVADLYNPLNDEALFQVDGLHPNATGAGEIASVFAGRL